MGSTVQIQKMEKKKSQDNAESEYFCHVGRRYNEDGETFASGEKS